MTTRQKIELRRSQVGQRINELLQLRADGTALSEEQEGELKKLNDEAESLETDYQAAIRAEGLLTTQHAGQKGQPAKTTDDPAKTTDPDAEMRELTQLVQRASATPYFERALRGYALSGPEAELDKHLNVVQGSETQIPWPVLLYGPQEEENGLNLRADAVTNLSAETTRITQGRWLSRLFEKTASGFFGITFESAMVGDQVHTVQTGGTAAAVKTRGDAQDAAQFAIDTTVLDPKRVTARYSLQIEDVARIPMLESRMRMDLSAVMMDRMEEVIFNGGAGIQSATGLLGSLDAVFTEQIAWPATGPTAANWRTAAYNCIDGLYAEDTSEVCLGFGVPAYKSILGVDQASVRKTTHDLLKMQGFKVRGTARVSTTKPGADGDLVMLAAKTRGMRGAAVLAMWPTIAVIVDPYSQAAEGQITMTAHQLCNFLVLRQANFRRFVADVS